MSRSRRGHLAVLAIAGVSLHADHPCDLPYRCVSLGVCGGSRPRACMPVGTRAHDDSVLCGGSSWRFRRCFSPGGSPFVQSEVDPRSVTQRWEVSWFTQSPR